MSEEENLFGKVTRFFKRRSEAEKSPEQLILEQKAQQAFYEANKQSLTEEGLASVANFEPPNAVFDLAKLGDGAVFRVAGDIIYTRGEESYPMGDGWTYGCVAFDKNDKAHLFVPNWPLDECTGNRFMLRKFTTIQELEKNGPTKILVTDVAYQKSDLNWEAPLATLPDRFFIPYFYQEGSYDITVSKIEVVMGGKLVRKQSKGPQSSKQNVVNTGLAPNPQMS